MTTAADRQPATLGAARVLIVCGSGGVGKTTTAAALAAAEATAGKRVLVLTIDPAKRLATALGLEAVGNNETRVALPAQVNQGGELWVAMLDTSASWDDLVRRHAPDADTRDRILANPLYRNITQRFVQSHDYIAMERLHELAESARFDLIVVDTPPSRHAIDFLEAPERMKDFFTSALLRWITLPYRIGGERAGRLGYLASKPFYQIADRILGSQFLQDVAEFFLLFQGMYDGFVQRATSVAELISATETAFVVVTTPEPAPMHEADFFTAELAKRNLRLGAAVMNRVAPPAMADLGGSSPLATESVALASSFLERIDVDLEMPEASDGSSERASLRRIAIAAAETHLQQIQLAEHQRRQFQRFCLNAEIRVALPESADPIDDVASLATIGRLILKPVPAPSAPKRASTRRRE
jgi:anion-transporting  ArsA/GET3 family ATPase